MHGCTICKAACANVNWTAHVCAMFDKLCVLLCFAVLVLVNLYLTKVPVRLAHYCTEASDELHGSFESNGHWLTWLHPWLDL